MMTWDREWEDGQEENETEDRWSWGKVRRALLQNAQKHQSAIWFASYLANMNDTDSRSYFLPTPHTLVRCDVSV
jgi:hypothetical protein